LADKLVTSRIIFQPTDKTDSNLYKEQAIDFQWVPGLAISQGRKSVINLHDAARLKSNLQSILEISTRSQSNLGVTLSAFNLQISIEGRRFPVEAVYQSSKIFQNGGPFYDLISASSLESKVDTRLKSSGELVGFRFESQNWPITSSPNFYDYLYIRALLETSERSKLLDYDAFSDIAYNQTSSSQVKGKSFNCQARSAAIYVSLSKRFEETELLEILKSKALEVRQTSSQLGLF
jgi:hypothetical protein